MPSAKPQWYKSFPLLIFLAALGLRLVPVLFTRSLGIGLDDMFQYDMLARSLALGNGFRWYAPQDLARIAPYLHLDPAALHLDPRGMLTTFRAPLYPAFLAIIYFLNGVNDGRFLAARLVQTLPSALAVPLTYLAARRILPEHEKAARLAAWAVALYPMLIIFPIALATENLFFILVLAAVLSLLELASSSEEKKPGRQIAFSLLSGLLLGLAALTRSVILPFAGLAFLWIWFSLKMRKAAILFAGIILLTILPWIVRNSLLYQKLTPIETSMGYNLYVGYYPSSTGTFTFGPSLDLLSILDDKVRDEVGTQKAIQFILQDPARFPQLALYRLGYFFDLELRAFTYFYVNGFLGYIPPPGMLLILLLLSLPFMIISLSAAAGSFFLPTNPHSSLLGLLFVGYLLPHVFILSEERFHLVLIPFLAVAAANFWLRGFSALKTLRPILAAALIVIAILLIINWSLELARAWPVLAQMFTPAGDKLYLPY